MELGWIESLLFGLVSGLAEFLPVSAQAHRNILMKLLGVTGDNYLLRLITHGAILFALFVNCRGLIAGIQRERNLVKIPKRRRKRQPDPVTMLTVRFLKSACFWMFVGFIAYPFVMSIEFKPTTVMILLAINGIILYIPQFLPLGNKDSRSMTRFDSLLLGLSGAFAVLPGISRVGAMISASLGRGAGREQALNWAFLMSVPALACWMGLDAYGMFTQGIGSLSFVILLQYIVSAAAAYFGASAAISSMRFLAVKAGYSGFAYYSWGAALFTFILFLAS